jgi:hypothetical protein
MSNSGQAALERTAPTCTCRPDRRHRTTTSSRAATQRARGALARQSRDPQAHPRACACGPTRRAERLGSQAAALMMSLFRVGASSYRRLCGLGWAQGFTRPLRRPRLRTAPGLQGRWVRRRPSRLSPTRRSTGSERDVRNALHSLHLLYGLRWPRHAARSWVDWPRGIYRYRLDDAIHLSVYSGPRGGTCLLVVALAWPHAATAGEEQPSGCSLLERVTHSALAKSWTPRGASAQPSTRCDPHCCFSGCEANGQPLVFSRPCRHPLLNTDAVYGSRSHRNRRYGLRAWRKRRPPTPFPPSLEVKARTSPTPAAWARFVLQGLRRTSDGMTATHGHRDQGEVSRKSSAAFFFWRDGIEVVQAYANAPCRGE